MCFMARNTSDTPRSRALGAELKRLRDAASLSQRELADRIGTSPATLNRWETGRKPPSPDRLGVLLGFYGIVGEDQDRLINMAHAALDPTWVAPGTDRQLSALIDFEETAQRITDVSPLLVPGLLQTESYAQAIMDDGSLSVGEIREAVTTRMGRKKVLNRSEPVEFVALIGEPALRRPIGGHPVLVEQLKALLKQGEQRNIDIRVVPDSTMYEPSLAGPYVLYEFDLAAPIVHFEHHRSSMFLPDKKDVEDMRAAAERIKEVAVSPAESARLIRQFIDRME